MQDLTDERANGQPPRSAFIDPSARVGVSDDEGNTIYVRAKMTLQVRGQVQRELASYRFDINDQGVVDNTRTEVVTSPQQQLLILLKANIVDWDGPAFQERRRDGKPTGKKVPVSPAAIARLDPDWDLIQRVKTMIDELNAPVTLPEPEDESIADPFLE